MRLGAAPTVVVVVVALGGADCQHRSFDLGGRSCRDNECAPGYLCNPFSGECVAQVAIGCAAPGEICPEETASGAPCDTDGAVIPCASGAVGCDAGCRVCTGAQVWSGCLLPACEIWQVESCAVCGDDCRVAVVHAVPVCRVENGVPGCGYAVCSGGYVDDDGHPANGCECNPSVLEICDGFDNDCDHEVDEGLELCQCTTAAPGAERCDGIDNDCNEAIDDGFDCVLGATRDCDAGPGPASGLESCAAPGCTWGSCVANDQVPPTVATGFAATPGESVVSLSWTFPVDADLAECVLTRADGASPPADHTGGTVLHSWTPPWAGPSVTYGDSAVVNDLTYSYAVFCRDTSSNWQDQVTTANSGTATPRFDTPPNPTDVSATDRADSQTTVTLTMPSGVNECWLVRKVTSYPTSHTDGTMVGSALTGTGATSIPDLGLSRCEAYFYAAFCRKGSSWNDAAVPGQNADLAIPEPWRLLDRTRRVALKVRQAPSQALNNVPVLVKLNSGRVAYADFGVASGGDMAFVDPGASAPLPFEVELWNTGGDSFVWVQAPTLDATPAVDCLYLYYGTSTATTVTATDVWGTRFRGVWHLGTRSSNTFDDWYADSTSHGNHAYEVNGGMSVVGSVVGRGLWFDASAYVNAYSDSSLNPTAELAISAWVNASNWTGNRRIVQKDPNDDQYRLLADGGSLEFAIKDVGAVIAALPPAGVWSYVEGSYTGAELRLYVDGVRVTTVAASGAIPTTGNYCRIGAKEAGGSSSDQFLGAIDELRIENAAPSDAWVLLQYRSMRDDLLDFRAPEQR